MLGIDISCITSCDGYKNEPRLILGLIISHNNDNFPEGNWCNLTVHLVTMPQCVEYYIVC